MPDKTQIDIPSAEGEHSGLRKVGIFAVVGLLLGLSWPTLAGVHIGPEVPGAKKKAAAKAAAKPAGTAPSVAASSEAKPAKASPAAAKLSKTQKVVLSSGQIQRCYKKAKSKKRIKAERCGKLAGLDRVLKPQLEQLANCPSALGLKGKLELVFDVNFPKQVIHVRKGAKSDLPSSTVRGVVACAGESLREVSAEKVRHKYARYRVAYQLEFYPPGSAPVEQGEKESQASDEEQERKLAAVTWDTALVRKEPRNGKRIMRLVRGTRVKIMERRKDWFRVRIGSREGWIYRGALGM